MRIEQIELYHIELPLIHPFETSFGVQTMRPCLLTAVHAEGLTGWGECPVVYQPFYSYETIETAWSLLRDMLVPSLVGMAVETPADILAPFRAIRGHPMARSVLENSLWDLFARAENVSLADKLGGNQERIPVGISLGIESTAQALLGQVQAAVEHGYRRVKLKIKPGWDVEIVRLVREHWPDLLLQVDANAAYTLQDVAVFRELDQFQLLMIEQPLHHDDIVEHACLQEQIRTPICLDESIQSIHHARWALDMNACRIINIKVARVGGLSAACQIHDLCQERNVPVWCGGMLETNIGRAANVALASLPNFQFPGDISASSRYYEEDIAEPDFVLNGDSTLTVPTAPGLGVQPVLDVLHTRCLRQWRLRM
jgi:O-succinylbenzoate synthase